MEAQLGSIRDEPSLAFLRQGNWWRRSFAAALAFAPFCLLPAILLTAANVLVLWGWNYFESSLANMTTGEFNSKTLEQLASILVVMTGVIIVGLLVSLWSLYQWMFKLTAFARAYIVSGGNPSRADFLSAQDSVKGKRAYLNKYWLIASAILLVPVLPLSVAIALEVASGPKFTIQGKPMLELPMWVHYVAAPLTAVLTTITYGYTFAAIVASAVSQAPPGQTALRVVSDCMRQWQAVCVVSIVSLSTVVLVTTPYVLFTFTALPQYISDHLWIGILTQAWLGLTSAVLWPWGLSPYCQINAAYSGERIEETG